MNQEGNWGAVGGDFQAAEGRVVEKKVRAVRPFICKGFTTVS